MGKTFFYSTYSRLTDRGAVAGIETSRILSIDLVKFTISIFVKTSNSLLKLALSRFYCEFLGTYKRIYRYLDLPSRDFSPCIPRYNGTIAAMGESINITVHFPEKPSVQFSQIETSFIQ